MDTQQKPILPIDTLRELLQGDRIKLSDLDGISEEDIQKLHKILSRKKVNASIGSTPTTFRGQDPNPEETRMQVDPRIKGCPYPAGGRWRAPNSLNAPTNNTNDWDEKDPNPKGSPQNDDYNDAIKRDKLNRGPGSPIWNRQRMKMRMKLKRRKTR